ncbi:MAG: insulinase family protein [Burkholderiaceae bacterium]|nr:insulinase family protein [Burkholderiaceae bacterium]
MLPVKTLFAPLPRLAAGLLILLLGLASMPARAVLPIEHWTSASGARVYFVRAPAIPMIDIAVVFDAGSRLDPPGKSGLASLATELLDAGVPGMDEQAIAGALADIGAKRGASASDDRAVVTLRSLTSEAELAAALRVTERTLSEPAYPAAVLTRERERIIQALREAQTKPETLAQQAFSSALYGGHPYGRYATEASVSTLQPADLADFHRRHFSAARAVVAIIGDVDRARAQAIAEQLTARLPKGDPAPVLPAVLKPAGGERRIEHPASQSHLMIGTTGIAWGDPDQFPLLVGNYVLGGGGFVSRLYGEVREKRGLAYGVYSYFIPYLQPGPFMIGLQTQREQTDTALAVVRETVAGFLRDGPTEAEVLAAKSNLTGGFPLRIDSNRKILDNLANIGFNRLPLDYLERWPDRVQAVTVAQIRAAFARHLRADSLVTVVVGDAAQPAR